MTTNRKNPTPRAANFYGMKTTAHVNDNGTWLEPEELCYPHGRMTRKAFAVCPDGIKRIAVCGLPDTYFSIPARIRVKGKSIVGYVTGSDDNGLEFRVMNSHKELFTAVTGYAFAEVTK